MNPNAAGKPTRSEPATITLDALLREVVEPELAAELLNPDTKILLLKQSRAAKKLLLLVLPVVGGWLGWVGRGGAEAQASAHPPPVTVAACGPAQPLIVVVRQAEAVSKSAVQ